MGTEPAPAAGLQCPAGGAQLTQQDVQWAGVDRLGLAPVDYCYRFHGNIVCDSICHGAFCRYHGWVHCHRSAGLDTAVTLAEDYLSAKGGADAATMLGWEPASSSSEDVAPRYFTTAGWVEVMINIP